MMALDEQEVLGFLTGHSVHTVAMSSLIRDNGLVSSHNRGNFYGYRNRDGILEGVALIGHTTLVEANTDNAMLALAVQARRSEIPLHLLMADGNSVEAFWQYYTGGDGRLPRVVCSERLFQIKFPLIVRESVPGLRLATAEDDLETIAEAHAGIAFQESGINPLETDRAGFLERVTRRVRKGRVWVVIEDDQLIFKADIAAETSEVIYLEGVYVNSGYRGKGIGSNCLSQLCRTLLKQAENICLLSNENLRDTHGVFLKAGFNGIDNCETFFV